MPKVLTTHIVLNTVKMLNFFPIKGRILDSLIPKTIISGNTLNFKNNLCLNLGQYCQVHEEEIPRNIQAPRIKEPICLDPNGNLQGEYKFISLNSGNKIVHQNWDLIKIPDNVIFCVNTLGSNQPKLLTFTDMHGRLIEDV